MNHYATATAHPYVSPLAIHSSPIPVWKEAQNINKSLSSPLTPPPVFKDHKSKVGTHFARINFKIDNHKLRLANLFCLVSVLGSCGNPPMQNSESRILFLSKLPLKSKSSRSKLLIAKACPHLEIYGFSILHNYTHNLRQNNVFLKDVI